MNTRQLPPKFVIAKETALMSPFYVIYTQDLSQFIKEIKATN
jgi:hypothetical protein